MYIYTYTYNKFPLGGRQQQYEYNKKLTVKVKASNWGGTALQIHYNNFIVLYFGSDINQV